MADTAGLLSDAGSNIVLVGNAGETKFFNNNFSVLGKFEYRKNNHLYAENNQVAPVGNTLGLVSVKFPSGFPMNAIQLGQDRNDASRRWYGAISAFIVFDRSLPDSDAFDLAEHFMMKYLF